MSAFIARLAAERFGGGRPSPPRAMGGALVAGAAAALVTYRLLRA